MEHEEETTPNEEEHELAVGELPVLDPPDTFIFDCLFLPLPGE